MNDIEQDVFQFNFSILDKITPEETFTEVRIQIALRDRALDHENAQVIVF